MNFFIYVLQVTICLIFFYGFYWIALQKEKTFQTNRLYLISGVIASLLLPLIRVYFEKPPEPSIVNYLTITSYVPAFEQPSSDPSVSEKANFQWMSFILSGYILVAILLFTRLIIDLFNILRLRRNGLTNEILGRKCILSTGVQSPFSFFDTIYLPADHRFTENELEELILHEEAHIRGRHSIDILFIEMAAIFLWISPVIQLFRKTVRELHEFIADAAVIRHSEWEKYAEFLLAQSNYGLQHRLSNQLVYSQLKNRLLMMTRKSSSRFAGIKYLGIIPLLLITFIMFSFRERPVVLNNVMSNFSIDTLPSVYNNSISVKEESENGREVFTYVEQMPRFGGCEHLPGCEGGKCSTEALYNFINKTIKYPSEAKKNGIKGFVLIQFIIEADGNMSNIRIVRGVSPELNEEALRVVNAMKDKWLPGYQNGKPVAVIFTLPIKFVLDKDDQSGNLQDQVLNHADEMPRFPGCEHLVDGERIGCSNEAMFKFIFEEIKYPQEDRDQGIEGVVIAQFIIDEGGVLMDPKIVRGVSPRLDAEVLRVIDKMKELPERWLPGRQNNQPVPVMLTIPFKFKLQSETPAKIEPGDLPDLWGEIGIKDPQHPVENSWIHINPNPATDMIEIEIFEKVESIRIVGLSKIVMWEKENVDQKSKYSIDVSNWTPGKYVIYLNKGGVTKNAGFIVQH